MNLKKLTDKELMAYAEEIETGFEILKDELLELRTASDDIMKEMSRRKK